MTSPIFQEGAENSRKRANLKVNPILIQYSNKKVGFRLMAQQASMILSTKAIYRMETL